MLNIMNTFLKRQVPMWVVLLLGACLALMTLYSFMQTVYFGTLVGAIKQTDIGTTSPPSAVLDDYVLCHERLLFFPRVIYERSMDICGRDLRRVAP